MTTTPTREDSAAHRVTWDDDSEYTANTEANDLVDVAGTVTDIRACFPLCNLARGLR
jgi:hypothetical protein